MILSESLLLVAVSVYYFFSLACTSTDHDKIVDHYPQAYFLFQTLRSMIANTFDVLEVNHCFARLN